MSVANRFGGLDVGSFGQLSKELSIEANQWSDALRNIFPLKDSIAADSEHKEMALESLFAFCADRLGKIEITGRLPEKTIKERTDYRDALTKTADLYSQGTYDSGLEVNIKMGSLVTGMVDYAEGPLITYYTSKEILAKGSQAFDEVRRNSVVNGMKYNISVEKSREERLQNRISRRLKPPKGKALGIGTKVDNFSTPQLVYSLCEYVQPTMNMVGKSEEEAEKMRKNIGDSLESLVETRRKLREISRLPRVLIENKSMRNALMEEVKPRSFYDMVIGHPLQHRISNDILSTRDTAKRLEELETIRMTVFSGRQCSQYYIYDQLFDITYGEPQSVLWVMNAYLKGWGYPPLPGYENLTAYKAIHPTKGLKLGEVLPRLEKYVQTEEFKTPVV
jgi:hypothetical protein